MLSPTAWASAQQERTSQALGCIHLAELRQSLDSLESRSPADDAKAAAERGDFRYWAVMRYDVVVPAIPLEQRIGLSPERYRLFEHTGDGQVVLTCQSPAGAVEDSTDVRWNQAAYAYAAVYNQALVRLGY